MEVNACFQEKIIIGNLHCQFLSIFPFKITEQNSTHYKPIQTIIHAGKEGVAHIMLYCMKNRQYKLDHLRIKQLILCLPCIFKT